MKLGQLIESVRRDELDDATQPYLWSDAELIEYAEDAENQAAERASLLVDATTEAICRIALEAGAAVYDLDPRVIRVRRVHLAGRARPLVPAVTRALDADHPGWEEHAGPPIAYLTDWQTGALRVVPTPTEAGTLALTVVRLPLVPLNDLEDIPEIHARFHRDLRHWIVKRAFSKRDADLEDTARAAAAEARFAAAFGPALSARTSEYNARNLPYDALDGSE